MEVRMVPLDISPPADSSNLMTFLPGASIRLSAAVIVATPVASGVTLIRLPGLPFEGITRTKNLVVLVGVVMLIVATRGVGAVPGLVRDKGFVLAVVTG